MFDEEELRRMTPQERLRLRRALAAFDAQDLAGRVKDRRRAIILGVIIVCCVVLAAWTGLLAATLPRYYRAGGWRGAWVGFDIALLAAFVATGLGVVAATPDPDHLPRRARDAAVLRRLV